ncbi:MAG TPA: LLM class flavin-dependent oxidoreductase, partial [Pseudonocardiaceae bacterium]|nr:LLM class flavin-dependent oxidoreductase [Pseudonocardiaceae bacterium]
MTTGMRTFRFLAVAAVGTCDAAELTATARRAEAMGYSALVLPDHLMDQHAPVPVLATVAAVTERLRIGTFVLNAGLRHPAVLAQDLASLDVLSGGRLEIGIGAGWNRPEHDAIGLPFGSFPARVGRLTEAIAVLKGY